MAGNLKSMHPDLKNYISSQIAAGRMPEQIRRELLEIGWRIEDINPYLPPTVPVIKRAPKRRPLFTRGQIIFGIVSLILVIVGSALLAIVTA